MQYFTMAGARRDRQCDCRSHTRRHEHAACLPILLQTPLGMRLTQHGKVLPYGLPISSKLLHPALNGSPTCPNLHTPGKTRPQKLARRCCNWRCNTHPCAVQTSTAPSCLPKLLSLYCCNMKA